MTSASGRGLRPGGVVRALGRLALLIIFGFGAGLLIGVLSEEPELLAGHIRGESEAVVMTRTEPLSAEVDPQSPTDRPRPAKEARVGDRSSTPLPQVAAPSVKRPVQRSKSFEAESPEALVAPVSRADSTRRWAIQVGAFSDERAAQRLSKALDAKGYPVQLLSAEGVTGRWRVRVQPVQGEASAREMAARLKSDERLPTWVLPMEGS